jgi:GT2 family glycosyltransferase/glycosyltransferase involved in cell wall biosynthesis
MTFDGHPDDHGNIIPGLASLVLYRGQLFAGFDPMIGPQPIVTRTGLETQTFQPILGDALNGLPLAGSQALNLTQAASTAHSQPVETTPGDLFVLWVNELPDWSLAGNQTIQLMITNPADRCSVTVPADHISIPHDTPSTLTAKIACHRAKATLRVTVLDLESDENFTETFDFDPTCSGGQLAKGYQQITMPLPASTSGFAINFILEYGGYVDDGSGVQPFLFLSDATVGAQTTASGCSFSPIQLLGDAPQTNLDWHQTLPFASLSADDPIELTCQKKRLTMPTPHLATVELIEDLGHSMRLCASHIHTVKLAIDGVPVETITLAGPDSETIIRFPPKYLDGTDHEVTLTDTSGSFTLLRVVCRIPWLQTPATSLQTHSKRPFPQEVFPQFPRRHESLCAHLAAGTMTPESQAQLLGVLQALETGPEKVTLAPLNFPTHDAPDVSIIIPAHNQVGYTYLTLCSLLLAQNNVTYEVILVDDGSTDETTEISNFVKGISVVRNDVPVRFLRACNMGAQQARGRFIALLNNDVEVTSGWLDALVDAFDRFDNVGLVGARLLNADGTLPDAGGIVWGNGNPWNYGRDQNPNDPRFSYARQADYLSGAALMMPTSLWRDLGGLSQYLEPMYFEDTDLAFKVRDAGYATWYVPAATVYHYEGMTSGRDVSTGFKAFQEVNRPKFKRKWARSYQGNGVEGTTPDLIKDRGIVGRVLFVDHSMPRPDNDAGSYAALQEIKLVQSLGFKVTFLPINIAHLGSYTADLQREGVETIFAPFYNSAQEFLTAHAREFDAFFITRHYVVDQVIDRIRQLNPDAPILFNNADLHFLREIRAAAKSGNPDDLTQARATRTSELSVLNKVDLVLSYNEAEHAVIEAYTEGAAKVVKCPWVVEPTSRPPSIKGRSGLSFLGNFQHAPNFEALRWMVGSIMPLVPKDCGDLTIYGANVTDEVRAMAGPRVTVHGYVPEVHDSYDPHRICIAPLRSGAGIKGKVLNALAYGFPTILTSVAAEGIGLRSGHDCLIVDTPEDWVAAIQTLTHDDALWKNLSANGRSLIESEYSFIEGRKKMRTAFEAANIFNALP